jgi:hypothetical protein
MAIFFFGLFQSLNVYVLVVVLNAKEKRKPDRTMYIKESIATEQH